MDEHSRFWREGTENNATIDDFLEQFVAEYPEKIGSINTSNVTAENFSNVIGLEGELREAYSRYDLSKRFSLGISQETREGLEEIPRTIEALEAKKRGMAANLDDMYDSIVGGIKDSISKRNKGNLKKGVKRLEEVSEIYHVLGEDEKRAIAEALHSNASNVLNEWRQEDAASVAAFNGASIRLGDIKYRFNNYRSLRDLKRLKGELEGVHRFYFANNDQKGFDGTLVLLAAIKSKIDKEVSLRRKRRAESFSSLSPALGKALAVGAVGCFLFFGARGCYNRIDSYMVRRAARAETVQNERQVRSGTDSIVSAVTNDNVKHIIYSDLDENKTRLYERNGSDFEQVYEFKSSDAVDTDSPKKKNGPGTPEGFYRVNRLIQNAGRTWNNPMYGDYYYELSYPNAKDIKDACDMGLLGSSEKDRLLSCIGKGIDPIRKHKNYSGHVSINDSENAEDIEDIKQGRDTSNCAVYLLTKDIKRIYEKIGDGSDTLVILENSERTLNATDYNDVVSSFL